MLTVYISWSVQEVIPLSSSLLTISRDPRVAKCHLVPSVPHHPDFMAGYPEPLESRGWGTEATRRAPDMGWRWGLRGRTRELGPCALLQPPRGGQGASLAKKQDPVLLFQ